MTPGLLGRLAAKYDSDLKALSREEIVSKVYRYPDFKGFLDSYVVICRHLREPADYTAILDELAASLIEQNVRYAEIIWSPSIPWTFLRLSQG